MPFIATNIDVKDRALVYFMVYTPLKKCYVFICQYFFFFWAFYISLSRKKIGLEAEINKIHLFAVLNLHIWWKNS